MRDSFSKRVRIIAVVFCACAALIVVKLYLVQVVHADEYRERAEEQQVAPTAHQFSRGSIFFTAKNGSLISAATLKSGFTLAVQPALLDNPERTYDRLNLASYGIQQDAFLAAAARTDDPYEEVGRRLPDEVGEVLAGEPIDGIRAYRERWRYYPGGTLASHSIGFMGYGKDGTTVTGQYGLERTYDEALSRTSSGFSVNFFADLFTNVGARLFGENTGAGGDVVTSIEPTVQAHLEEALAEYQRDWHAKSVGGVILEPRTGNVIALAALPSYDPNDIKNADPNALSNPLVERVYEFGSTMKPLTIAAALELGVITPATTYNDRGSITVDTKTISNFDGKARGIVSMQDVLNQSLNVGIAHVVELLGPDALRSAFQEFGITEETGIDLPSEASPLVSNLESPRTVEYITAGFGQGIALTPIAMARALATLANHGRVPQPHVGLEVRYPGGIRKEIGWTPPREALRPETVDTLTRMLVTVVDTALRGGAYKIDELSIAAKTGTAQIANPGGGGYYPDRYLHSFFGYFPAYEPRFLVFLFSVEPQGAQYASETLTDPFFSITKFLVTYYAIAPDRAPNKAP